MLVYLTDGRESYYNALALHFKEPLRLALKLIICYISRGATNIDEVSSGFHQADWSTTLGIVYCLLLSNQFFVLVYLFTCLSRNLILTISAQMRTSAQFKFALYLIPIKFRLPLIFAPQGG